MSSDKLLQQLRELEVALHQHAVRNDRSRLDALLHDDFVEFGRSGRCYGKAEILEVLLRESSHATVWSQDFALTSLSDDVALLTYKSASVGSDDQLSRHALRSSLWLRTGKGWRMRFHQATPTAEFDRRQS